MTYNISSQLSTDVLETFEEWNHNLSNAGTEKEVFRILLDTILEDVPVSEATIYCFDKEAGRLRPEATSMEIAEPISPGNNPIWEAFRKEAVTVFTGVETGTTKYETDGHQFAVPVGEKWVLVAEGKHELNDESKEVRIVPILCAIAGSQLKTIQCEAQLEKYDQRLEQQSQTLEWIEIKSDTYRSISRTAISADTREEMEKGICNQLLENSVIQFVWFGELDRTSGQILTRSWAGTEQGYLERTPIKIDGGDEPVVRAARNNEVCVIDNVASESVDKQWRLEALERGFNSIKAIPLSHEGVLHGTLTVYANRQNAFNGATELAKDVGNLIGYTITTLQGRNGLLDHTLSELDVEINAPACFFVRFVRETETNVSLKAMSPTEDGSVLVFVSAENPELFVEYAENAVTVDSIQRLDEDGNGDAIKAKFDGSFIGLYLSTHRIILKSASATPERVQITVSPPPEMTPRQALEIINAEYPNSTLLAKRESSETNSGTITSRTEFLERLTDRQREAVERAYRSGYFETPKEATGKDVAASMNISTSAFHNHLRAAESELFSWLFDT